MTVKVKKRIRTKFAQYNREGHLICYQCRDYKPETDFYDSKVECNIFYRNDRSRSCKVCTRETVLRRGKISRARGGLRRALLERWHGLRERSKKLEIPTDVPFEYILELWSRQQGICNISGISMTYEMAKGRTPTNVSIDKIERHLGYIKGNIQLVCMAVNQMKSDMSIDQLILFCRKIVQKHEEKNN